MSKLWGCLENQQLQTWKLAARQGLQKSADSQIRLQQKSKWEWGEAVQRGNARQLPGRRKLPRKLRRQLPRRARAPHAGRP
ncbi:hypothetical protein COCSUDRAFT_34043 [Coccomyxa subellipsoidea C-169]|uniref:Uncharacterized protein n=1 Tax=Coccomyxa subellipsoidea (strain C-169) TaxID=574566 RepID=I0YNZ4_COCSC|nr:hypothetical protein COCSUDRAFT_34043 [Coccomyxa subellipsoidea C-169]EIE20113.1 hypothetical protein COCSUDRAFT_34043 [Coccomyxa subellipsoidea C-169]|eukprot:XP_005644657.1 hypothetical protein COCSUDRAFT_34043 [Coccomyxa subellipsoidea C-169]